MPRNISELFDLNIILYENEVTDSPTWKPMQGRKDTNFVIRLSKGGELVTVDQACNVVVKFFCYETTNPTVLKDVYTISPTNGQYKVTVIPMVF